MRFSASEKLEIIRLVEGSDLPVKLTLDQLGIPRSTFYDWYGRFNDYTIQSRIFDSRILEKQGFS